MAPPRKIHDDLKPNPATIKVTNSWGPPVATRSETIIEDVKAVSSYNWLSEEETESAVPTIQVPGAPPLVSFPKDTDVLHLEPDSGHHYIDQNAARMKGRSGMIPGLAACYSYSKTFRVEDYDIISDRNNLIKLIDLLREVEEPPSPPTSPTSPTRTRGGFSLRSPTSPRGRGGRGGPFSSRGRGGSSLGSPASPTSPLNQYRGRGIESMNRRSETSRFDADLVAGYDTTTGNYVYSRDPKAYKTLVLTRWEPKNEELIYSSIDFRGFGFSFLSRTREFLWLEDSKVVTKGTNDVTGFHCLVEFKLFGIKMLVRYHADGCDMSREQFVRWVAKDGLRILEGDASGLGFGDEEAYEAAFQEYEEDEEDTFDLLESFKTLEVKDKEKPQAEAAEDVKGLPKKPSPIPAIPIMILQTPNHVFPQDHIMQVKTRGKFTGLDREKLHAQLFFSQTSNVFVAYHSKGHFAKEDAAAENISEGLKSWGENNEGRLKRLLTLLWKIRREVAQGSGKGAIVFCGKANEEGGARKIEVAVHERVD
ncbi:hypothetical protein ABW19_dt0200081 [Dactylella cylindrospora]|nr:hypothetical protein ABW19_dt0200081 [Dactylella cylindrospora]